MPGMPRDHRHSPRLPRLPSYSMRVLLAGALALSSTSAAPAGAAPPPPCGVGTIEAATAESSHLDGSQGVGGWAESQDLRSTRASCGRQCRQEARDCRRGCRRDKRTCLDSCSDLRGREKRKCRRACRRTKRECNRSCRQGKGECKEECRQGGEECHNAGFESGSFDGWTGKTGTHRRPGKTTGIVQGRHTLQTATSACSGFDCEVGGQTLPVVPPGGGAYSARLGNTSVGSQGEKLIYKLRVTESNKTLRFLSAVVLQDPGHPRRRPYFEYRVKQARFPRRTLEKFKIEAKDDPYFDGASGDVFFRRWSCQELDLSRYVGKEVTVEFTTADCGEGGHFGYAYVDGLCSPAQELGAQAMLKAPNRVCLSDDIQADGSDSLLEADHFWSVEKSDAGWGRNPETEATEWFLTEEAGVLDLKEFYSDHGRQLECNTYYRVKVAVRGECVDWDEDVKLVYVACPEVDAGPDRYICPDTPLPQALGSPANDPDLQYTWTPANLLDDPASGQPKADLHACRRPGSAGVEFTVSATDPEGCVATDSVNVVSLCPARAWIEVGEASCCGGGRRLTARLTGEYPGTPYRYLWSPGGQTTPSIEVNPSQPRTYSVTVSDPCFSTTAETTVEPGPPRLTGSFPELAAPNAFTPNGDGVNDLFVIHDLGLAAGETPAYNATNWRFIVFDNWGSEIVVMEGEPGCEIPNSSLPLWDGRATRSTDYPWWMLRRNTRAGEALRQGTYPWEIYLQNCSPSGGFGPWRVHRLGHVTILR